MLYEETIDSLKEIIGGTSFSQISTHLRFGDHPSVFRGEGFDFWQIREYDPERDSPHQIMWQHYSVDHKLYVREAVATKDIPVLLLADVSSSISFGAGAFHKRKLLVETAGIIGLTVARSQDPVGLAAFADGIVMDEPFRAGADYVYYLLQSLCSLLETQPHERSRTDFGAALQFMHTRCFESSLIVIISDFIGFRGVAQWPLLKSEASRHDFIFFVLHDPEEFTRPRLWGSVRIQDMETGELISIPARRFSEMKARIETEQKELVENLERIGIDAAVLTYGEHVRTIGELLAKRRER